MTSVVMPVSVLSLLLFFSLQCVFDFHLLFFDQESLHRIVLVMFGNQLGELLLFLNHGSADDFFFFAFAFAFALLAAALPLFSLEILPSDSELALVLVIS